MADKPTSRRSAAARPARKKKKTFAQWSKLFLAHLATSSNVTASAHKAGVSTPEAYAARRARPEFNRAWQQALCEGYDHLEMELLYRLRTGEIKRAPGAKIGARTFDNAVALRQLAAHKESVMRQRAIGANQDAARLAEAISERLETMRQRALDAGEDVWAAEGDDE
jgi:hypothetical protein